ncbi:MAG: flagellar brake protein, partial [Burkholderiales bacterium]|nr:flagellar brake protein [Burkholderiales bacterium]
MMSHYREIQGGHMNVQHSSFPGQGIRPKIWERVQLARPGNARFESRLIGYIRGVSLLVTQPVREGLRMDFLEGESLEVRMFTGSEIHVFETHVMQVCIAPVHYLHLAYPEQMRIQPLRRTPWVDVRIPATLILADASSVPALLENLSENGARLGANLDVKEEGFSISFVAPIDEMKREIQLPVRLVRRRQ